MSSSMTLTTLETALAAMFGVFVSNQGKHGKMTKHDFIHMMNKELPSFTEDKCEDDIFEAVDLDEDGYVDFKEFALLLATYAAAHHDILQIVVAAYKH